MNSTSPRLDPLPLATFRPEWLATLARIPGEGLKGSNFPLNVMGTIAHNGDTFGPFLEYWVMSKSAMSLSVREQELVILRMGYLFQSDYVWKHHIPVAEEFGLTPIEIDAARSLAPFDKLKERDHSLLALTDELVEQRTIGDKVWNQHGSAFEARELIDLIALVSQYVFFALVNNAMKVRLEGNLGEIRGFQC